ncbi:MAG: hypothetical protein EPO68_00030 [Planctomycetota bacterium]|nr:MAG: hypothetical protein EPO68_00030 [Planctomycetota bacterium]
MKTPASPRVLLATLLVAAPVAGPLAAQHATRPFPLARTDGALPGLDLAAAPAAELLALRAFDSLTLSAAPLDERGALGTLELERVPLVTPDAELWVDGALVAKGDGALDGAISVWKGRIAGASDSDVLLAFSPHGTRGWIAHGGRLLHLIAEPGVDGTWAEPRHALVDEASLIALGMSNTFKCAVDELPRQPTPAPVHGKPAPLVSGADATTAKLECRIAFETDYQYYQIFNDLPAAQAYVLALTGAISARYVEQINTVLALPYLGFYTANNDPWTSQDAGGSSIDVLYEVQAKWSTQGLPVDADLGHLISGAGLGGGVAWLDVLCVGDYCYGVTGNINGGVTFPITVNPMNWDFMATAHEIGHNFNALHTHDYCPPADECAPSGYFGQCQTQENCITNGTVMSYCHLCPGGTSNVTTYFHPFSVADMRARAENSCLLPFESMASTNLGYSKSGSAGTPSYAVAYDELSNGLTSSFASIAAPTTGFLIVGATNPQIPLFGGTLVPSLDIVLPFPVASSSPQVGPATINGGFTSGLSLYAQGWFVDPGASELVSASNGLRIDLVLPDPPPALVWKKHPSNGKEYAVSASSGYWGFGEGLARQYGGHLAKIDSAALQTWLSANLGAPLTSQDVWIGFHDQFTEGTFKWTAGGAVTFTNWKSGQPNDFNGQDVVIWEASGQWIDNDGWELHPGLLERPATP